MAISNYTELTQAVAAWLDVATADMSANISNLVTIAETRIQRELRVPDMEATTTLGITAGAVALPSDYVELKYAYINTNPIQYLEMTSTNQIYQRYPTRSADGVPVLMARDGSNLIFGPYPDSAYNVVIRYYKHLTSIQTTVNTLFTNNPDLWLFASLSESEPLIGRDQRIPLWESKYQMVKELVNGEGNRSHYSAQMSIRPG